LLKGDYGTFERKLSEASKWEDRVRICLEGIFNNVFFRGAKIISDFNIGTLRERFPELYETVRDNNVRRALVVSELFKASLESAILRKLGVEEIEIELDLQNPFTGAHGLAFMTLIRQHDFTQLNGLYGGEDAVKVFFKSIFTIAEMLYSVLSYPILADVWRAKSGLEAKRDMLRETLYSKTRELAEEIPEEAKGFTKPEKAVNEMVYFLWHWYAFIGRKVKRKIERLLEIKL